MCFAERKLSILYVGKQRQQTWASRPLNVRFFIFKILLGSFYYVSGFTKYEILMW